MQVRERLFIDGEWVAPSGTDTFELVSPSTEEVVGRTPAGTPADVERAVAAARAAFDTGPWPRMSPVERAEVLSRAADLMEARSEELAALVTNEVGSPITFSRLVQIGSPIRNLRYYAELAAEFPFEETRTAGTASSLIVRVPVGVVAAIPPWNMPVSLSISKLAPAFVAGCTAVLKPPAETALDALALADIFEEAGLPAGVLNVVPGLADVGEALVSHPGVDRVAFTGSTAVGRRVAALAAERLTRVSLELGGKAAAILLDDVVLEEALPRLLNVAFVNSGQACMAQTRVLVPRSRGDEITEAIVDGVGKLTVGDPLDASNAIGPMVSARHRERVEGYIALGQEEGAKVAVGGGRPAGLDRGWYVEPTVFVGVDNRMRIAREEIFGPVVSVIAYDDVDDAVAIANDSEYGLGGSVWTAEAARGLAIAHAVHTGMYSVNGAPQAAGTPFGGVKQSGIGREMGPEGLRLYVEDRSIAVLA
ncbi:MAG: aldehyde dehydrogenase [Actinobacteria bacterium]|nr:aldehyde dehydrogenase [Actinomycetota bacterium]